MVQPDKRLLWHPRYDDKFVVGGNSQITLYEWAAEYPEIRHVTSQHDLHFMKCFAWSPDPSFDDLIAVGLSTGKVDLIRLEAGKQAQRKNVLSSGPSVTLPVRNSRTCNALAFNPVDPNYLAVGLDKVRGDASLVIWDISTFALSLTLPINNQADISSVLTTMAPLPSRPQPLLPRLENQTRIDARIIQQYAPTEVVSSLSFLPDSSNLLLAGISHRWLRLFDLRSPAAAVVNVASKVHGIATDPFDQHRIACFGDTAITVWDARRLGQPLLTFSEKDALADGARIKAGNGIAYANIEFSNTRRECLATLERDANYVRFWDLRESRVQAVDGVSGTSGAGGSSDGETRTSRDSSRATRRSWAANLAWGSEQATHSQSSLKERDTSRPSGPSQLTHVLADTRRTKSFPRPLSSFALVPMSRALAKSRETHYPLASNVMVVNKEGDLELYAIHDTTKQVAWSARGDLAIGAGVGMKVIEGYKEEEISSADGTHANPDSVELNEFGYRTGEIEKDRLRERDKGKTSRSRSRPSREGSQTRGRSANHDGSRGGVHRASAAATAPSHAGNNTAGGPPALFGRGDDEGFPALTPSPSLAGVGSSSSAGTGSVTGTDTTTSSSTTTAASTAAPVMGGITSFMASTNPSGTSSSNTVSAHTGPTGLAASRPGKPRTYSPASIRKYRSGERGEPRALARRSLSRADTVLIDDEQAANDGVRAGVGGDGTGGGNGRQWDEAGQSVRKEEFAALHTVRISRERPTSMRASRARDREGRKQGIMHVVQDDISMIMRRRAKAGYGLSQPHYNISITQDDHEPSDGTTQHLSELWAWIYHSQDVLCVPTPRLHGYDFSYHGLLGIWEGFHPTGSGIPQPNDDRDFQRSLLLDLPGQQQGQGHHHTHTSSTGSTTDYARQQQQQQPFHRGHGHELSSQRSRSPADDWYGNWGAALNMIAARRGVDQLSWKPPVPTTKLVQRQVALQLCGWSLREEELGAAIKRWEKEGKLSRAACWLVFSGQYSKAVDLLMRSDDETHQMMSGTVAALAPLTSSGSSRGLELREHYGRLIIRLHDPYFRVMLTHLALGDWTEVLEEEVIPFRERIAIAFQFLDDKTLSSYLKRTIEHARLHGDIDALIITGLTPTGMNILQAYLDRTGDVQSAAILSSYVCPQRFKDKRTEKWLEAYRDLLDGFKLHHLRVGLDIERGQILHEAIQNGDMPPEEWAPRQILIRCHYCNKPVSTPAVGVGMGLVQPQKGRPTACSNCSRELPRCSVCLMTLSIVHDAAREIDLGYTHHRDTFDDAIVICQTCRHGGHAVHILEWFTGEDGRRTHDICPVADCECRCADEF